MKDEEKRRMREGEGREKEEERRRKYPRSEPAITYRDHIS